MAFNLNSCSEEDKKQENTINKIDFYSQEGLQRIKTSEFNNDFFQLVNFFQPQINPLYCGIATSVILLNSLHANEQIKSQQSAEVKKPKIFGGGKIEFNSYLQSSFLNEKTNKIKQKKIVELKSRRQNKNGQMSYDAGLNLQDLADILSKVHDLKVEKIHAKKNDKKSIAKFRQNLKKYLKDNEHFIVVNFYGKKLKNKTGGHISPLAAYHEKTDSVLVLDVALHKDKWYFVGVKDLYSAMHTKDGENYRGYLIVNK